MVSPTVNDLQLISNLTQSQAFILEEIGSPRLRPSAGDYKAGQSLQERAAETNTRSLWLHTAPQQGVIIQLNSDTFILIERRLHKPHNLFSSKPFTDV